jgi:hypothetical protein
MTSLGFENYAEALKIYLSKYREVSYDTHEIALQHLSRSALTMASTFQRLTRGFSNNQQEVKIRIGLAVPVLDLLLDLLPLTPRQRILRVDLRAPTMFLRASK